MVSWAEADDSDGPMKNQATRAASESGYAMAALLVSIAVMGVLMSALIPVWTTAVQREREAELVFRGEQYARAIGLFQRKYAGGFPPSVDVLIEQKFLRKKYADPVAGADFRILYQADVAALQGQVPGAARPGEIVGPGGRASAPAAPPGQPRRGELASTMTQRSPSGFGAQGLSGSVGPRGGMVGVTSTSGEKSFRLYNGRDRYDQWLFVYAAPTLGRPGAQPSGAPVPGGPAGRPRPGMGGPAGFGSPRPGPTP
jgi:type II secretory pathway pseudopilin PulG